MLLPTLATRILLLLLCGIKAAVSEHQCSELYELDASTPGTVSSPLYGKSNYPAGLWCEYRITAPQGHRIRIVFKDMDIVMGPDNYCSIDKLAVYGKDKASVLGTYCGDELPRPRLSHKGENEIRLLFISSENSGGGRGFLIEYESSPDFNEDIDEFQCSGIIDHDATKEGTVATPFYGKLNYHNNLMCEFRIRAPEGYRIKVSFEDLDIEASQGCAHDKLVAYSKDRNSTIAVFCGNTLPRPILSKEGENEIRLLFGSDPIISGRGFLVRYTSSPYLTSVCEDGLKECRNRNCYKAEQKCDGIDNCLDGTDEEDCGRPINTHPEKCGVQDIQPNTLSNDADRVVGGEEALAHSWPWQVSLQYPHTEPSHHFCGGTLINEQWVLTALHCVSALRYPGTIKVRVGAHNLLKKSEYEQHRIAIKIIVYPDLQNDEILKGSMIHDIALLKLNAPVSFNEGVQPACVPSADMHPQPHSTCYSTGWGYTRGSGSSTRLKQSDMRVNSRNECGYYEEAQICVSKPYHSTCHGDSGSPLNCKVGDKWYSYGALSLLVPTNYLVGLCSGPDARTLYTSTVFKSDWIKEIVNKYS